MTDLDEIRRRIDEIVADAPDAEGLSERLWLYVRTLLPSTYEQTEAAMLALFSDPPAPGRGVLVEYLPHLP